LTPRVPRLGRTGATGRAGQPAELAPAYVLLASDEGSYMTGAMIPVTGGRAGSPERAKQAYRRCLSLTMPPRHRQVLPRERLPCGVQTRTGLRFRIRDVPLMVFDHIPRVSGVLRQGAGRIGLAGQCQVLPVCDTRRLLLACEWSVTVRWPKLAQLALAIIPGGDQKNARSSDDGALPRLGS
jgi:hypothetical protein